MTDKTKLEQLTNEILSSVLDATVAMDRYGSVPQPTVALYGLGTLSAELRARVEEWTKKFQVILTTPLDHRFLAGVIIPVLSPPCNY